MANNKLNWTELNRTCCGVGKSSLPWQEQWKQKLGSMVLIRKTNLKKSKKRDSSIWIDFVLEPIRPKQGLSPLGTRSREPWDQGWRLFSVSIIPSATYCSAVWCPTQGLLPDHLGGLVDHTPWNSYPRSKCVIQYPISDLTYYFTLIQYPVSDQTLSGCTADSERCPQQPNSCSICIIIWGSNYSKGIF